MKIKTVVMEKKDFEAISIIYWETLTLFGVIFACGAVAAIADHYLEGDRFIWVFAPLFLLHIAAGARRFNKAEKAVIKARQKN